MGRLSLLTLRIGLTCMRASSPTGFRHGSAVLNVMRHGSDHFTRLAGTPARSGPKNIVMSPGGLVEQMKTRAAS